MKRLLALLVLALAPLAAAQVGYPLASTLASPPFAALKLKPLGADQLSADGVRLRLDTRGAFLTRASVTLPGTDPAQAGDYLGLLTGYGADIAGPFAQYLKTRAADLGRGFDVDADEYRLHVQQNAGQLALTVALREVPTSAFAAGTHVIGDPKAPVVVREFSDFQCPYCQQFSTGALVSLLRALPKDVRFEFHHFPLENIHPEARAAAEAAECAGQQGQFFAFHDALFADRRWIGTRDTAAALAAVAARVGLNTAAYAACVAARSGRAAVDAGLAEGQRVGVNGTPSVFVNGYPVPNPYDPADITRLINLARAK